MIIASDFLKWLAVFNVPYGSGGGSSGSTITVQAASIGNLAGYTYYNGPDDNGIGATLTAASTGVFVQDGETLDVGQLFLYKDDTTYSGVANGVYVVSVSEIGEDAVLTRSSAYDSPAQINASGLVVVQYGTVNATSAWNQTSTIIAIGTTPLVYIAVAFGGIATDLEGGVLGSVPYQSAPDTTLFVSPNTTTELKIYTQTGTGSAGAMPAWMLASEIPVVTQIDTNNGITGGPITSTGTIGLEAIADLTLLSNISGSTDIPIANNISDILDACFTNQENSIIFRNVDEWTYLAPGADGTYLQSAGASDDLLWSVPPSIDTSANYTWTGVNTYTKQLITSFTFNNTNQSIYYGYLSGAVHTSAVANTFLGWKSGAVITEGSNNVFIGDNIAPLENIGNQNTFVGSQIAQDQIGGDGNTGCGAFACGTISGDNNSCLGLAAGYNLQYASGNTLLGYSCGNVISTADSNNNTIGGYLAFTDLGEAYTTARNMVGLGSNIGATTIGACEYSTALGSDSDPAGFNYSTALGAYAVNTANHQIMLGTVDEKVIMPGTDPLRIPYGAANDYVLTSDENGNASWQPPTGSGGLIPWVNVTSTSQVMAVNTAYAANNAGLVTLTLPETSAFGDVIQAVAYGTGGFEISQGDGQQIIVGNVSSSLGSSGFVSSNNRYDSIYLVCMEANSIWIAANAPQGNLNFN